MKAKKIIFIAMIAIAIIIIIMTKDTLNNSKSEDLFGKIIIWSEKDNLNSLKLTGESFKKLYPKVQIEYVNVDKDKLYNKIVSGFASSSGLPDIFSIKDDSIQMFVNTFPDGFLDISSTVNPIKGNFINSKILQCTINGKVFAFPWDTEPSAVFYRKDIFAKANVFPEDIKTWDDYIKAGKAIGANTAGVTKMLPIDTKNEDILFREMLNQLNTGYFDKDGKVVLNSENSIKAMEVISRMNEGGLINKAEGLAALKIAIKKGTIATLPYGSSYAKLLTENAPEQSGKWRVMKLPAFEPGGNTIAVTSGSSVMITKASKNKKVALKFAEFATTDSSSLIKCFDKYGALPAYIPFYSTQNFDNGATYFDDQKIWLLFTSIAKDSVQINFTEKFSQTQSKVIKAQADILNSHANVQSRMDGLQTELYKKPTK